MPSHCVFVKMCTLTPYDLYVFHQMSVSAFRFIYHHLFTLCALSPLSVSPDRHRISAALVAYVLKALLDIQHTCNTAPLCPTTDILQLCKYYKHVLQCVGLGPRMPHYCLRFITLAQALRHPSLYTAGDNGQHNHLHRQSHCQVTKFVMGNENQTTL